MQERFASTDENPGEIRCPRCGMFQTSVNDSSGRIILQATCRICDNPLPLPDDQVDDPAFGSHCSQRSHQATPQIQWHDWMETRRLERWIWFLFVLGLVTAVVIGLLRS